MAYLDNGPGYIWITHHLLCCSLSYISRVTSTLRMVTHYHMADQVLHIQYKFFTINSLFFQ